MENTNYLIAQEIARQRRMWWTRGAALAATVGTVVVLLVRNVDFVLPATVLAIYIGFFHVVPPVARKEPWAQAFTGAITGLLWGPFLAGMCSLVLWQMSNVVWSLYPTTPFLEALTFGAATGALAGALSGWSRSECVIPFARRIFTLSGHTRWTSAVSFSRSGRNLATGGYDGTVRVWDLAAGSETLKIEGLPSVAALCYSPDNQRLAGAVGPTVEIWDAVGGTRRLQLTGHAGPVWSVEFSPDGRTLSTAGSDAIVRQWNAETGELIQASESDPEPRSAATMHSVVFSPDGKRLAAAGRDGTIRILQAQRPEGESAESAGRELGALTGHRGDVVSLAFSPDGQTLASGGFDRAVRLWNSATYAQTGMLWGHEGAISTLAFSPSGRWLATGGEDGLLIVWDVLTSQPMTRLPQQTNVACVRFAPAGDLLAAGCGDGTVRIWAIVDA